MPHAHRTRSFVALGLALSLLASCSLSEYRPGPPARVTVSVSPTSASLAPNAQQVFTASVTGASDTAVTWTATGGAITAAGASATYTAPATPGSYQVTAASVAAPGSRATATVVVAVPDPPGVTIWTRQFGTSNHDDATGVTTDPDGNVVVVGRTLGDLAGPNSGYQDVFVRKYDGHGNELWSRQYGGESSDYAFGVAVDPGGNVLVAGSAMPAGSVSDDEDREALLLKYAPGGNLLWSRTFTVDGATMARDVATDAHGDILVAGLTVNTSGSPGPEAFDAFVSKLDPGGNEVWTRQFGTAALDGANRVAVDAAGAVYVAGMTFGALDGSNVGADDIFLRKYSPDGALLWGRQFGTAYTDGAAALAVDGAGRVVLAGALGADLTGAEPRFFDAFVRQYGPYGSLLWDHRFGTPVEDVATGVATDGTGNVLVTGFTAGALDSESAGLSDAFVRKYATGGTLVWARQFGTSGMDQATGVAVDPHGNVLIAGVTSGGLAGTSAGGADAFVRKLGP